MTPLISPLQQTLALLLSDGLGVATYWQLHDAFGSIDNALQQDLKLSGRSADAILAFQQKYLSGNTELISKVEQEQTKADELCLHILHHEDPRYPVLLRDSKRPPPILYVQGSLTALSLPQIAIVGSRHPSPQGHQNAYRFANELCESGFVITSGLALGVDVQAHRGALAANAIQAKTLAVLGTGIDRCYPKSHYQLAQQIVQSGGALVSEFPLGVEALPQNFPQRNRIVSGLSCGTLVVEAALKSGSLITARYALEQNREVFAIPGSIHNPLTRGCHAMIKSGAKLVETTADIVCELSPLLALHHDLYETHESPQHRIELNVIESAVYDCIGYDVTSIDSLTQHIPQSIEEVLTTLFDLELKGLIENTGLGYVRTN